MNRLLPIAFALLALVCGCTWSSAQPLGADAGGSGVALSEDAGVSPGTEPFSDDASVPFLVDAAGIQIGTATMVAAGGQSTCAVSGAGSVWCWGSNLQGQLGASVATPVILPGTNETVSGAYAPVQVPGVGPNAVAVAVGSFHACALSQGANGGSEVQCWGSNQYGQVSGPGSSATPTPVTVSGLGANVKAIAAGGYHSCALGQQSVMCWGGNANGQLGNGNTGDSATPVAVLGLSGATAIAAGGGHSCAITATGGVECWGLNNYGQLGDGTTTNSSTPVTVSGLAAGVKSIATGNSHTCALDVAGGVSCWGWGFFGQLGNGAANPSSTPVKVSGLGVTIAIAAGGEHACAAGSSGSVTCWGDDQVGQLGDNNGVDSNVPVAATGLSASATSLVAGAAHSCAIVTGGAVECWGWNVAGQLGDDTGVSSATAVPTCGF